MPHPVIEAAEQTRAELLRTENATTTRLIRSYEQIYNRLQNPIASLEREIENLSLRGELSIDKVRRLTTYASLQNQIQDEINRYGGVVDNDLRLATNETMDRALAHSKKLTQSYFLFNTSLAQAFEATWDNLPKEAIETLLGFLAEDSQLHINLTRDLGSSATRVFEDNLMEGIALGYNPKKISSAINNSLGQPLSWALSAVRTSQLYTYREATRANYLNNNEILSSWKWYAALDGRCCLSCFNQHGREFTLEQVLNDHHQGRCTQIPILPNKYGITQPDILLGEEVFNSLPESQQVQRMGNSMHKAYKAKEFQFNELSVPYQNDIYGEMVKEASLVGLIGDRARHYYE